MTHAPFILASASPRRRELLARVGVAFEVRAAGEDEHVRSGESALDYARRLAGAKADAVAATERERWVLGADTVVELDGVILGKARDPDAAREMLTTLSDRTHRVSTAFSIRGPGAYRCDRVVTTEVVMRRLGPEEIEGYVRSGEWQGKAGAYAVQGMAAAFVSSVCGSITNVIGLPLAEVLAELGRVGAAFPDYTRGVPS